jgi:hypothetical protein
MVRLVQGVVLLIGVTLAAVAPRGSSAAAPVGAVVGAADPTPIEEVEAVLPVPPELDDAAALAAIDDIATIFVHYQPNVPRFPGVNLDLTKRVVSPSVLELPVSGHAVGFTVKETANVAVSSAPLVCAGPEIDGRTVVLDFGESSRNVQRRIDRIEITACLETDLDGVRQVRAIGRMYAGWMPEDPSKSAINERLGRKAFQIAFIQQVPAILDAVREVWGDRA